MKKQNKIRMQQKLATNLLWNMAIKCKIFIYMNILKNGHMKSSHLIKKYFLFDLFLMFLFLECFHGTVIDEQCLKTFITEALCRSICRIIYRITISRTIL